MNSRKNNVRNKITKVDSKKTKDGIVEVFYNKFSSIAGVRNEELGADRAIFSPNRNFVKRLSTRSVKDAIASLSIGIDFNGVHSNHLKSSPSLIIFFYSKFFNSWSIHNHIPNSMLTGVTNPIIKNKAGNVKDSQNFRDIMISSNLFKVFEYLLLPHTAQLPLSSAQFRYRGGSSTVLANALLKETIIAGNISDGGSVYSCFLDMSRAFEYVNHELLLQKLVDRGMPDYIVKILKTTFSHTNVKVRVNGSFSDC